MLEDVRHSREYLDWHKTVEQSYFWDDLLQKTFFFIENGLSAMTTSPTIQEQSQLFKRMAREDRAHRYCLAEGFLSFLSEVGSDQKGTRMLYYADEPDTCYVLLLLPRKEHIRDEDYRSVRRKMLRDHCTIIKADYPEFSHIIGVAHESAENVYTSEDFVYLDASEWSAEQQIDALQLKKEYKEMHLLAERHLFQKTFFAEKMKGRDRNKPCPCGSGKKFKYCCGRN